MDKLTEKTKEVLEEKALQELSNFSVAGLSIPDFYMKDIYLGHAFPLIHILYNIVDLRNT